jgi:A/G-specific adenine glycosylase
MLDNQTIISFQEKIRKRWETHRRDLPRRNTTDPYAIRISESMLCQTQVSRVIDYYHKRLETFPTVKDLAKASNEEVLRLWSGLGYNSRALRLKQAAIIIQNSKL